MLIFDRSMSSPPHFSIHSSLCPILPLLLQINSPPIPFAISSIFISLNIVSSMCSLLVVALLSKLVPRKDRTRNQQQRSMQQGKSAAHAEGVREVERQDARAAQGESIADVIAMKSISQHSRRSDGVVSCAAAWRTRSYIDRDRYSWCRPQETLRNHSQRDSSIPAVCTAARRPGSQSLTPHQLIMPRRLRFSSRLRRCGRRGQAIRRLR